MRTLKKILVKKYQTKKEISSKIDFGHLFGSPTYLYRSNFWSSNAKIKFSKNK